MTPLAIKIQWLVELLIMEEPRTCDDIVRSTGWPQRDVLECIWDSTRRGRIYMRRDGKLAWLNE